MGNPPESCTAPNSLTPANKTSLLAALGKMMHTCVRLLIDNCHGNAFQANRPVPRPSSGVTRVPGNSVQQNRGTGQGQVGDPVSVKSRLDK